MLRRLNCSRKRVTQLHRSKIVWTRRPTFDIQPAHRQPLLTNTIDTTSQLIIHQHTAREGTSLTITQLTTTSRFQESKGKRKYYQSISPIINHKRTTVRSRTSTNRSHARPTSTTQKVLRLQSFTNLRRKTQKVSNIFSSNIPHHRW